MRSPRTGPSVVVAGELMLDVLFLAGPGDGDPPAGGLFVRAGGSAANVALALAATGHRVVVAGKTGPDPNGAWLRRFLAAAGVRLAAPPAPDVATGYVVIHRRGGADRVVYVERGANRRLDPSALAPEALLEGAAWLHLSGYGLAEPGPGWALRELAAAARRRGVPVSLDPGLAKAFPGLGPRELLRVFGLGLDGGPDLFLPSAGLARLLTGRSGEEDEAPWDELLRHFRAVVVKSGSEGAWAGPERVGLEPGEARLGVDVSGAGDTFDAACVAALLGGLPLNEAVRRANTAAARYVARALDAETAPGAGWVRVARQQPPVLISACLFGAASAYDGRARGRPAGAVSPRRRLLLPVCPEQLGGLTTPRTPAEIQGPGAGEAVLAGTAKVLDRNARDVTDAFLKGARRVLELARATGALRAVLKEESPSCGPSRVHDGAFAGRVAAGRGVTAEVLRRLGVEVVSETGWRLAPPEAGGAAPPHAGGAAPPGE